MAGGGSTLARNSSTSIVVRSGLGSLLLSHYSCAFLLHPRIRCCDASSASSRFAPRFTALVRRWVLRSACLAMRLLTRGRRMLPQDAQKVFQQGRSEGRSEAYPWGTLRV